MSMPVNHGSVSSERVGEDFAPFLIWEWPLQLFQEVWRRQFLREAETGNLVYCLKQEVQTSLRFEVLNNKFRGEWKSEKLQDSWAGVKCTRQRVGGEEGPPETGAGFVWRECVLNRSGYRGQAGGQGVISFYFLMEPVFDRKHSIQSWGEVVGGGK